jgi:arylsulfatase A-like enzyme
MPTILEALGGTAPRAGDGRALLPLLEHVPPADWRDLLFYEYDFRDVHYSQPESALGLSMDECALCVVQDANFKYVHFAALPALFFDLKRDPHQFTNLAEDPAYAGHRLRRSANPAPKVDCHLSGPFGRPRPCPDRRRAGGS